MDIKGFLQQLFGRQSKLPPRNIYREITDNPPDYYMEGYNPPSNDLDRFKQLLGEGEAYNMDTLSSPLQGNYHLLNEYLKWQMNRELNEYDQRFKKRQKQTIEM